MNRFARLCIKIAPLQVFSLGLVGLYGTITTQATIISTPNVYLHDMPRQTSNITSTISKGSSVKIIICNSAWCYVKNTQQDGWKEGWVETKKLSSTLAQATSQSKVNRASAPIVSQDTKNDVNSTTAPITSGNINVSITIVAANTQPITPVKTQIRPTIKIASSQ